MSRPRSVLLLAVLAFLSCTSFAFSLQIPIPVPGDKEFVIDRAGLIDDQSRSEIVAICDGLLREKAITIVVVTIESMSKYSQEDMGIETFSMLLFNQWKIGHAELNGQSWNKGILLLVSKEDRRVRIELGAGWGREKDSLCEQIISDYVVPQFKRGRFGDGTLQGVEALSGMAREQALPRQPMSWWQILVVVGSFALFVFTIVSLVRSGASGWAWLFWGACFAILGSILYNVLSNSDSNDDGFMGGMFGGGFSGGGGASGSW